MKIEIDIKNKPKKNDIAIFDGEKWQLVSLNKFLNEINNHIKIIEDRVSSLEEDIKLIKGE